MSHFVLDVTHIGEGFVSLLFNTDQGKETIREMIKERFNEDFELTSALSNRNIAVNNKRGDAKSQIDVALIGKSCCYAVELKLGNAICTPGGYCQNYLNNPYSPGKKYFSGQMIPILSRMGMDEMKEISVFPDNKSDTSIPVNKKIPVNKNWILMVRTEKIVEKLNPKNLKLGPENLKRWNSMRSHCEIVSLEKYLRQLKDKGLTGAKVENLLKECITPPNQETYIESWGISDPFCPPLL